MHDALNSRTGLLLVLVSLSGHRLEAAPPPRPDLSVASIEVTQGVQSIPAAISLVDDRPTTVRVYVDIGYTSVDRVSNVQGRLRIYSGATLVDEMLSDNGPITAPATPDRENANHSLNFTFQPEPLAYGLPRALTLEVILDPADVIDETNELNNTYSEGASFSCRFAPRVQYVPVDYQSTDEPAANRGEPDASLIEPGVGDSMLWAIYPWPQDPGTNHGRYKRMSGPPLEWVEALFDADEDGRNQGKTNLKAELARMRAGLSPRPDFLYGWVKGNPCPCNGSSSYAAGIAFGNTDPVRHQRTFAHELGHLMNYWHDDPWAINDTGETGWDVGDRLGLGEVKIDTLADIMVGGLRTDRAWINPARYEDVYDNAAWECPVNPPVFELRPLTVITVDRPEGPWILDELLELDCSAPPIDPVPVGPGEIRILDSQLQPLYATHFEHTVEDDGDDLAHGTTVTTPSFPEAHRIELWIDGQLEDTRVRSPQPPTVQVVSPPPGTPIGPGTLIQWVTADQDGDPLKSYVRYSPDGQERWIPLGGLRNGNSLLLRPEELPASPNATIEVRVTDGFNTSVATVSQLNLGPDRPPVALIRHPRDGSFHREGANVMLIGHATDREDGDLDDTDLEWVSDVDGFLGSGDKLNLDDLTPGVHHIEFGARDSQSTLAVDTVTIDVAWRNGTPSPGESSNPDDPASQVRVAGYDAQTGQLTISYTPACQATDHGIYGGALENVSSYVFDPDFQRCSVGVDGVAAYDPGPGDVFFLVVGNDGVAEGSYGRDSNGNERPEALPAPGCDYPQQLSATCE